jgi:hypothetical protein
MLQWGSELDESGHRSTQAESTALRGRGEQRLSRGCEYTGGVKLLFVIAMAAQLCAQAPPAQSAAAPEVPAAVHLKAVRLVEASGMRERLAATMSDGIEQGKAAMQKQCPDCQPEFMTE